MSSKLSATESMSLNGLLCILKSPKIEMDFAQPRTKELNSKLA
jgi:hypothetical protein